MNHMLVFFCLTASFLAFTAETEEPSYFHRPNTPKIEDNKADYGAILNLSYENKYW